MAQNPEQVPIVPRESRVVNDPGSWHNPTKADIRQLSDDVWVVERGYVDHGMDVGGKMAIVRLPDRRLFIHSALPVSDELRETISSLGTVSAVVAPNTQHVDFVKWWKHYFPNATCLAPPGLKEKRTDVPFDDELSPDNVPHECYKDDAGTIQQHYVGSCPIMGETVFFHVPSRTLVLTDLIFTFPSTNLPWGTRFAKFMLTNAFAPVHRHFLVKDKEAFSRSLGQIEEWDFKTLVPTHGDVVTEDAVSVFKRWYGRQ